MTRQAILILLCLLFAMATSSFSFVHALLGGCDDIEKDFKFEKALREKCNKELEEANQRASDADDVKRQLIDCENAGKKLKNDIEKLKKEKEYAKGEATDYENMLIREQSECRKKDKRCKASEEQLQQTQNKLTECEDKLIDCGGTQSVQAKKHVEFLKGQINDLKKHRDRLEVELEETQTSFRNLRYTETICQSNYSDLVQQLSEYKSRGQILQDELQGCQKRVGATGSSPFYGDNIILNTIVIGAASVIILYLLYSNESLKKSATAADTKLKEATELNEQTRGLNEQIKKQVNHLSATGKPTVDMEKTLEEIKEKVDDLLNRESVKTVQDRPRQDMQNAKDQTPVDERNAKKAGSPSSPEPLDKGAAPSPRKNQGNGGSHNPSFSSEDEDDPEKPKHTKGPNKGGDETSESGETVPNVGEPLTKLEELVNTKLGSLEEKFNGLIDDVTAGKEETSKLETRVKKLEKLKTEVAKVGGLGEKVDRLGDEVTAGKKETDKLKTKVDELEETVSGFGDAGEENELNKLEVPKPTTEGGQTGEGAETGMLTDKEEDFDDSKNREHSDKKVLTSHTMETGASVHQPPAMAKKANLCSQGPAEGNAEPGIVGSHGDGDSHGENAAAESDPAVTDQDKNTESPPIGGVSPPGYGHTTTVATASVNNGAKPQADTLSNSSEEERKNDLETPV